MDLSPKTVFVWNLRYLKRRENAAEQLWHDWTRSMVSWPWLYRSHFTSDSWDSKGVNAHVTFGVGSYAAIDEVAFKS